MNEIRLGGASESWLSVFGFLLGAVLSKVLIIPK